MIDEELLKKIEVLEKKTDAVLSSVEKMRKFFFWTLVAALVMIVLPLIGLVFAIPVYLDTISGLTAGF